MLGKLLLAGAQGHQGIKLGTATIAFGAEDAAQTLGFLLAGAILARHLNQHIRIRQIQGKIAHP